MLFAKRLTAIAREGTMSLEFQTMKITLRAMTCIRDHNYEVGAMGEKKGVINLRFQPSRVTLRAVTSVWDHKNKDLVISEKTEGMIVG